MFCCNGHKCPIHLQKLKNNRDLKRYLLKSTYNSMHFPAKMNTSCSKAPTTFIAFHTNYDHRGRVLINKDLFSCISVCCDLKRLSQCMICTLKHCDICIATAAPDVCLLWCSELTSPIARGVLFPKSLLKVMHLNHVQIMFFILKYAHNIKIKCLVLWKWLH